jgi:hypothetical protein
VCEGLEGYNSTEIKRAVVSWKSRDDPLARLGSALGRWNPIEQTGLCIYSCFRTYRLELFNRVLSNQPTAVNTERAEPEPAAEKSPDKYSTIRLVKLVSSYSVFSKVHNHKLLQLFRAKDYRIASWLLFFGMLPSPTSRRPITRLNLGHTRTFFFELQTETVLLPHTLPANFSFTLWPGNYTKVEFYRKAYATVSSIYAVGI